MSDEDKKLKKAKIEQNRTKRKPVAVTIQCDNEADESPKKMKPTASVSGSNRVDAKQSLENELETMFPTISSSTGGTGTTKAAATANEMPTLESSSADIVDRLVNYPEDSSKLINQLMHTPSDAVAVMTKIIHSQKDAMRLIGHLIGSPGDALKIISKIMNSPFDALTVFTKFMSSPTDALEIIAKIASSPEEVLQFIQQLMNAPEDALQIMNKFMNSPAEALKMLNQMVNSSGSDAAHVKAETVASHSMIKSMLSDNTKTHCDYIPENNSSASQQSACDSPQHTQHHSAATRASFINPKDTIRGVLDDVTDEPLAAGGDNTLAAVICEAISLEYDLGGRTQQPVNRDLNEAERAKLNELIVANKALNAPLDEDLTGLDRCSEDVSGIILYCFKNRIKFIFAELWRQQPLLDFFYLRQFINVQRVLLSL